MLAIWRVHGIDELHARGVGAGHRALGASAGMICWFEQGVTDSFGPQLEGMDCLGFLPGSACPHYDGEEQRRPRYRELVDGGFTEGIAADDGVAVRYAGTEIAEIVVPPRRGRVPGDAGRRRETRREDARIDLQRSAEIQVLLEGHPPACGPRRPGRVRLGSGSGGGGSQLKQIADREYGYLDEVGEELARTQPAPPAQQPLPRAPVRTAAGQGPVRDPEEANGESGELMERPQIDKPDGDIPFDLLSEDLVTGDGAEATSGSKVTVHDVGVSFTTGDEFDASWNRGQPFQFKLGKGQVIPGWDQGVQGMRVGGRRKLTIPSAMAYGARGAGGVIQPHEPLVFVVDLLAVD